uniref:Uncharacterized protein n=1 Tax=Oreochromis aureus TaxID=47969 RepID=A0AAZ1XIW1_OREAU
GVNAAHAASLTFDWLFHCSANSQHAECTEGLRQPVCLHIPLPVFHMLHSRYSHFHRTIVSFRLVLCLCASVT